MGTLPGEGSEQGNPTAETSPAKGATLLTGEGEQQSTPSSTESAAPTQLPRKWMEGLTAEQKTDEELLSALSKFERGIPDLAQSYIGLEKKLSEGLTPPSDDATDEEKERYNQALRKALDVPEKPEDYQLSEVELPEGVEIDEQMRAEFLSRAHALNIGQQQADALYSWYMQTFGQQVADARTLVKTTMDEAAAAVRSRYGAKAQEAEAYMQRGFRQFATPEVARLLESSGLGNHPDVIDMFIEIGKFAGEHHIVDPTRGELETATPGKRSWDELARAAYPSSS